MDRQFAPGSQEMSGDAEDLLPSIRPTSKGEAIDGAIHRSHSTQPQMMSSSAFNSCTC